jgi:DNA adenine methylase
MLLRYFGAKKRTGRDIMAYAPSSFSSYIEPFCGSAGMLWHVPTSVDRWINDANPDVVAFHLALRDDPKFLDRLFVFAKLETATELRQSFYKAKWDWHKTGCPASYWLLNQYGHGRLVRRSRSDFASFDPTYLIRGMRFPITRDEAEQAKQIMQGVKITCVDFRDVFAQAVSDSWTLVDPPYWTAENIYDCEMTYDDHEALRDCLVNHSQRFFMTIGHTELSHRLYQVETTGLDIREHRYGNVNLVKGGSTACTELYLRNYLNL